MLCLKNKNTLCQLAASLEGESGEQRVYFFPRDFFQNGFALILQTNMNLIIESFFIFIVLIALMLMIFI